MGAVNEEVRFQGDCRVYIMGIRLSCMKRYFFPRSPCGADTVFDILDGVRDPNGFTFEEFTPEAFMEALTRAMDAFRERKSWDRMVRIGMHSDYSWDHSAGEYDALYAKALSKIAF